MDSNFTIYFSKAYLIGFVDHKVTATRKKKLKHLFFKNVIYIAYYSQLRLFFGYYSFNINFYLNKFQVQKAYHKKIKLSHGKF